MVNSRAILERSQDRPIMPRDPNWISVKDVAAILQVSPETVWRMQRAGKLASVKTYKPSATLYYWRPDVEAYARRATQWANEELGQFELEIDRYRARGEEPPA